ncbi:PH domain-containing protein [Emticicia soli]|uniref:PH domain-containing protein n=1 Tax=Emticicia soli TaxID=2027878 RepID=A0ABW5JD84_9BACT
MDTKFNSKISSWLFLPLIFFLGILLVITIIDKSWGGAIILVGVTIFILSFLFRTYYEVEGKVLKIVSGFIFKKEIDIMSIRKIEKTNNPLSSPALSLKDRIEIYYSKFDSVIISPERQSEFIATLKLINKNISTNL